MCLCVCVSELPVEITTLSLWLSEESLGYQQSFRPNPRLQGRGREGREGGGKGRCEGKGGGCINSSTSQSGGCLPDRDLRLRFWADRHIP